MERQPQAGLEVRLVEDYIPLVDRTYVIDVIGEPEGEVIWDLVNFPYPIQVWADQVTLVIRCRNLKGPPLVACLRRSFVIRMLTFSRTPVWRVMREISNIILFFFSIWKCRLYIYIYIYENVENILTKKKKM